MAELAQHRGHAAPNTHPAWRPPLPAVDLRGVDLDAAVSIERGRIALYPHRGAAPVPAPTAQVVGRARHAIVHTAAAAPARPGRLPPPGQGLNQPALLTFRRMALRQPADWRTVEAFRGRLIEASARLHGVFVHFDPEAGVWLMKLDSWL